LDSDAEESSEEEEEEPEEPPPEAPPEEAEMEDETKSIEESAITGTMSVETGLASSLPSGLETPDAIELRKASDKAAKQLFTVLEQKAASVDHKTLVGSDHVYVVPEKSTDDKRVVQKGDIEVTIDPEELEGLDEEAIQSLYETRLREAQKSRRKEDSTGTVSAKASQQKRKSVSKKDNFKF